MVEGQVRARRRKRSVGAGRSNEFAEGVVNPSRGRRTPTRSDPASRRPSDFAP